jgi:hypothetical protein
VVNFQISTVVILNPEAGGAPYQVSIKHMEDFVEVFLAVLGGQKPFLNGAFPNISDC